ncbi:DinB family protein [Candidatus Palauibacter irciniicola]|uniref:DinB family protein n=1 Tax=Candidatus Palauibacter irciniicola TaxID=3056733 RepID=UPI003B02D6B9
MNRPSDPYTTRDSLTGVRAGIDRCLERTADPDHLAVSAPDVSAWSVQDHLEHLLLADRNVLDWVLKALTSPNPATRKQSPHEFGVALLARGSIPRGRGPAPDFTLPQGLASADVRAGLRGVAALTADLEPRLAQLDACRLTLPHHVLGHFTPAEWLRFLHLHHRHHAAIIHDILAA